jgi:phage N-6-adenine-methyltransferase
MTINKSWFTSDKDRWGTPQGLFEQLNREFHFTVDVCADANNRKCQLYWDKEQDGLKQDWSGHMCWCNPPYSYKAKLWVAKASQYNAVCLLPARTDTVLFHEYIWKKAEIRFLQGRLKFNDGAGRAPFPSMIVIFKQPIQI